MSLSTFFRGCLWFKSLTFDFFARSLQSKETQKVHQHFRAFSAPENKKSGSAAAGLLHWSPKTPIFARFLPKMRKETPSVVVDKRRFFYGCGGGICSCSSRRIPLLRKISFTRSFGQPLKSTEVNCRFLNALVQIPPLGIKKDSPCDESI